MYKKFFSVYVKYGNQEFKMITPGPSGHGINLGKQNLIFR